MFMWEKIIVFRLHSLETLYLSRSQTNSQLSLTCEWQWNFLSLALGESPISSHFSSDLFWILHQFLCLKSRFAMGEVSLCVLYCLSISHMPCWYSIGMLYDARVYSIATQLMDVKNLTVFEPRWPKSEMSFIDD